jgi:hypothetical protein
MTAATASLKQRVGHELLQYLVLSTYLYICFGTVLLYKWAVLHGVGVAYELFGIAIIKALVLGKFILLAQAFRFAERTAGRLAVAVIFQAVLFVLLLIVLSVIENIVVDLIQGHAISASVVQVAGGSLAEAGAASLLMLLVLIPYFAFHAVSRAMGEGELIDLLFTRRAAAADARAAPAPLTRQDVR